MFAPAAVLRGAQPTAFVPREVKSLTGATTQTINLTSPGREESTVLRDLILAWHGPAGCVRCWGLQRHTHESREGVIPDEFYGFKRG